MKFNIQLEGLDAVRDLVTSFSDRRVRATAATALTRTARELEAEWKGELFTEIDSPTSYTINSPLVTKATAETLTAELFIRDKPARPDAPAPVDWLLPQEEGGGRFVKKFERALMAQGAMPARHKVVPARYAQLDGYGNISRGQITHVLTQLGSALSPGYQRTISKSTAKRMASAAKHGREYVAITKQQGGLRAGIYQRRGRQLLPVFIFVTTVRYQKRIDLQEIGNSRGPAILAAQFGRALGEQILRQGKVAGTARIDE